MKLVHFLALLSLISLVKAAIYKGKMFWKMENAVPIDSHGYQLSLKTLDKVYKTDYFQLILKK